MILISIRPFALRKIFLIAVMLLCFSAFCFADPVLMARRYAPAVDPIAVKTSELQNCRFSDCAFLQLTGWDMPRFDSPSREQEFLSVGWEIPEPMLWRTEEVATG